MNVDQRRPVYPKAVENGNQAGIFRRVERIKTRDEAY